MDTLKLLTDYYTYYDEEGRLLSRHGSVEFLTTMRYIERYLTPGMRILEIGAATGRYSHALARKGYPVDAVELVQHNIEIFKKNTALGERVSVRQGDARNLEGFCDNSYDITLLLGPMYHLFTRQDQLQALKEAIRVTKTGGVVFAAYCSNDATMVQYMFARGMIREDKYKKLVDPVAFKAAADPSELFMLYRKEEIDELMESFDTQRLHFVGTDMATNYMRAQVDEMDEELFDLYLKYHFSICERADLIGASHHFLDVFRKRKATCRIQKTVLE